MTCFASILFGPNPDTARVAHRLDSDVAADLHLDRIRVAMLADTTAVGLDEVFDTPLGDPDLVVYRQEVFHDLEHHDVAALIDTFADTLASARTCLDNAGRVPHSGQRDRWHLDAADSYFRAVTALHAGLTATMPASRGLRQLCDYLGGYLADPTVRDRAEHTRALMTELDAVRYTVHADDATVTVAGYRDQPDYTTGTRAAFARFRPEPDHTTPRAPEADWADMNHIEEQVLDAVATLYPQLFARLTAFRREHPHFLDPALIRFDREIRFYRAYQHLADTVGARFCYPDLTDRDIHVQQAVDLALAHTLTESRQHLVGNDIHLSGRERVLVVTGPNNGGKTTFARTVGQLAHLAALGCPVPAVTAALPLPDRVFTHFERREHLAGLRGKLDDELVRIHDILTGATHRSLIVMNESFASTTTDDALLIGTDVLHRIIDLGAAAVFVTFLDELAALDEATVSLVADTDPNDPTVRAYRLRRRSADGRAYADAVAAKYHLAYTDITRSLQR